MTRRLAIFDIDGTLTDTEAVDASCFASAVQIEFGIGHIDTDWSGYAHVSDAAVLSELVEAHRGRPPEPAEVAAFIAQFVRRLERSYRADPAAFAPVAGASPLLAHLREDPAWSVAIATGGWGESARLKLALGGFTDLDDVPFASSDDGRARGDIVGMAIDRAHRRDGGRKYERLVLIGDAVWDVDTAVRLGLPFLGVATDERAVALRERGASAVVAGFRNLSQIVELLHTVSCPARA